MENYTEQRLWAKDVAAKNDKTKMRHLEILIDDLAHEDFFGTEMQFDPRGDFRETYDHEEYNMEECEELENDGLICREDLETIDKDNIEDVMENLINTDYDKEDKKVIHEEILMKLEEG